ncbi:contractile injection system tape measure protein [Chryseobacterium sp. PBS4-4]|uniref:Contractile injection system tape measure protein n=1 Tax=Chryseobacterium edaphi TaxID=2976532 RepID=A0ABT2W5T1_9FLAO|nr:contractile injection system tape measure protein [Chryseobacterium edaphi]MCU7617370.1 contractile injection system tape measure protein [Chryseobacterium edaphi]
MNELFKNADSTSKFFPFEIENAGLIILNPFFSRLFHELNLCDENIWKNDLSHQRAVLITEYLVAGKTDFYDEKLFLNKILCGFPLDIKVNFEIKITLEEKEICDDLLRAVIEHWSVLKNTSPDGLRNSFLQRFGQLLITSDDRLELFVENRGIGILLNALPWGIGFVKTPWMNGFLYVNWTSN